MNDSVYPYSFTFQSEKQNAYLLLQRLLLVISGTLVVFSVLKTSVNPIQDIAGYMGIGLICILLLKYVSSSLFKKYRLEKGGGLLLGVGWLLEHQYGMCLLTIGLTILFTIAITATHVWVGKTIVLKIGPFKRNYDWKLLQQVILKDGILTIDFKNNRLLQQRVELVSSSQETAFNLFCQTQLHQHTTHA